MHFLVCSTFFNKTRAYGTKNYENSLLPWEIHHGADILVFPPVEFIAADIIYIFYHLGSLSIIYSVGEKIPLV